MKKMLKSILLAAGTLLALVVVTVVIGYLLPKQHSASRAISLKQKPGDVFALISDFKAVPSWRPDVKQIEMLPAVNGQPSFREVGENGALTMEVLELKSPERMVTQIADKNLPFGGQWVFEISPAAGGSRLNITEKGEIYNPVFRFVARFFLGYTRSLDAYLKNVSHKFGENAVPEEGNAAAPRVPT
jgi:hypothetical protein